MKSKKRNRKALANDIREPAVIYTRVSSKEQEREGYSIDAQLELLRSHAKEKGIKVGTVRSEAKRF